MSVKRTSTCVSKNKVKRSKNENSSVVYFHETLKDCGLVLNSYPDRCVVLQDTIFISIKLKKTLLVHGDSVSNIDNFFKGFKYECKDTKTFVHYAEPTITQKNGDASESVLEVLLNVTPLQSKLIGYIFDQVPILLHQTEFNNLVKNILKAFLAVDTIEYNEMSEKFIELLKCPLNESVKQEIILAIPDIIAEHEHSHVASELIKIMSDDESLIQSIFDCFSYLSLSESQFEDLHKKILEAMQMMNRTHFPTFVKFLLTPGHLTDGMYENNILNLRTWLQRLTMSDSRKERNQVATAKILRNSMISSKEIAKLWLKVISNCKDNTEHKPIDVILFLILYSISDVMQKDVEKKMRTQINLHILKEDLIEKAFNNFKPILKDNLPNLICLSNALLKADTEPAVQSFASHMYTVMFSELKDDSRKIIDGILQKDYCREIIGGLLQLILNCQQSKLIALNILHNIASNNLYHLELRSDQILTLLDEMGEVTLTEIRAIMNLVCGLAFGHENSMVRDKVHINIEKYLGSSIPEIKIRGILTGIYAVKYLMKNNIHFNGTDNITLNMTSHFPKGDLLDAANIIEHINQSTKHFPDMRVFFYDELTNIIQKSAVINEGFLKCLVKSFSKEWEKNFLVETNLSKMIDDIRVTQMAAIENFNNDIKQVVNIAGITLESNEDISIDILSPLFKLVGILCYKKENGNISNIQEVLEYSINMPAIDWNSIDDLSASSVPKILDCCRHFVNFLRELLNTFTIQPFAIQENEVLKQNIFKKLHLLRTQEINIETILSHKNITYKPPIYYSQTVNIGHLKENVKRIVDKPKAVYFRPLNITLIELIRCDLTSSDAYNTELTFEGLSYLLNHINNALEKILLPRIKRNNFLNEEAVELYSPSDAEIQAKIISGILLKLMAHIKKIMYFLDPFINEAIDFESEHGAKIKESTLCLERIYNLLSVYFQWFEFKERHIPLLMTSLKTIAEVTDDESPNLDYLFEKVVENFQKQEKYCITYSSAVSLIRLMLALKEHWTGSRENSMIKDLSQIFLSKQWETPDGELEKGLIYNQGLEILTKAYCANNTLIELKRIVASLLNDVKRLREPMSVLTMFKNINKNNFPKLFKKLGFALYDKIKDFHKAEMSEQVLVVNWEIVATILYSMSKIESILKKKQVFSDYSKIFDVILKIFMTKGFPILEVQFQQNRILVQKVLENFVTSAESLKIAPQPYLRANLSRLECKTNELLGVPQEKNSRKNTNKLVDKVSFEGESSTEDSDNDLPDDYSLPEDDDNIYSNATGRSDPVSQTV